MENRSKTFEEIFAMYNDTKRAYDQHMSDPRNEDKHQQVIDKATNTLGRITMVLGSLDAEEKRYALKIRENIHMMVHFDGFVDAKAGPMN